MIPEKNLAPCSVKVKIRERAASVPLQSLTASLETVTRKTVGLKEKFRASLKSWDRMGCGMRGSSTAPWKRSRYPPVAVAFPESLCKETKLARAWGRAEWRWGKCAVPRGGVLQLPATGQDLEPAWERRQDESMHPQLRPHHQVPTEPRFTLRGYTCH